MTMIRLLILGKVNSTLTFEDWVSKIQSSLEVEKISHINITIGNGILNQYVRKFAANNSIPIKEYTADYKTYGDNAKLIRNQKLVGESDLVVGFLPKGSSAKSWISRTGIYTPKDAIVIIY